MRILIFTFLIMTVKSVSFGQILVNVHLNTMETVSIDFYAIDSIIFQLDTPPETITYHTQDSIYHFELAQIDSITYASEWDLVGHLNSTLTYGEVIDIDGNVYPTIVIGNQKWMAENLRVSTYSNGDPIEHITDSQVWETTTEGAWIHTTHDPANDIPYGKLYNLYTVLEKNNVCPEGWRVPYETDFIELMDFLGGIPDAGFKMRSMSTVFAQGPQYGDNQSGFSGVNSAVVNMSGFSTGGFPNYAQINLWTGSTVYLGGIFIRIGMNNTVAWENPLFTDELGTHVRCIESDIEYSSVTDVDGNEYQTIIVDGVEWMAENLKVTKFNNMDDIPMITTDVDWSNAIDGAYCEVDNNPTLTDIYGLLYNQFVVDDTRNVCPSGWHVPSFEEWNQWDYILGGMIHGIRLIKPQTGLWVEEGLGAKGDYGFDALPAGRRYVDGLFQDQSMRADFWSSDDSSVIPQAGYPEGTYIIYSLFGFTSDMEFSYDAAEQSQGASIRCVRD